jgi:hypothetical protein
MTNIKIEKYKACGIRFGGEDKVLSYIEEHKGIGVGENHANRAGNDGFDFERSPC